MKANRIDLFSFKTPAMRAFHVAWVSFFLCFFGWFGVAPLMPIIRKELGLSGEQISATS
jgi:MFS transporter, NNP family, nitrate/nitrite transporter